MPVKMGGNENGRSMGERLAIDPNQTNILYFGSRKAGLWKSTDRGLDLGQGRQLHGLRQRQGDRHPGRLFDKASGAKGKATPTIYAAVANNSGSLYRSTDAGATWKPLPGQPTGLMASHLTSIRQASSTSATATAPARTTSPTARSGSSTPRRTVHRHHARGPTATTSSATAACRSTPNTPGR